MKYFDFNATTPLSSVAEEVWIKTNREYWQNPSSPYAPSARAKNHLESLRERFASILGCQSHNIVFNSGATEGNNAVIDYFAKNSLPHTRILISAIEHPSVLKAAENAFLENADFIPVSASGVVEIAKLRSLIKNEKYSLISVMAANNETGVIQPWKEILEICNENHISYHCDASQWVGKLRSEELGKCDFVTACAHKFGGPKGVGFLKISDHYVDFRSLQGGEQEFGHRGGTENLPAIAAMLSALEERILKIEATAKDQESWKNEFLNILMNRVPGVKIIANDSDRLWNTVSLILPQHDNTRWVILLDKLGFAISTGSACASGKEGPSHVLAAMKYSPDEMRRVIRISGGSDTSRKAWHELGEAFSQVWKDLNTSLSGSSNTRIISI